MMLEKYTSGNYKYVFSIVMAVYNVEPYVAEAIDSLVCQDIGFENNVQLVLVDDGSADRSGEICDEYKKKYPNNIVVIHKENGGVSSARNLGLEYIEGRYVNFMDSDDKLSPNTLSDVACYFDIWGERTDIISIPFEFFERMTGRNIPHNRKFAKGSRLVNLFDEYSAFQFSLGAGFVRASVAKNMHFDESLVLSEDAKEIYKILMNKPMLGLVNSATYYYRKRQIGTSAVDSSIMRPSCYTHHMKAHYYFMVENYLNHLGYVPKFVQFAIMYDLQWKFRLQDFPSGILSEEEKAEFVALRKKVLSYIDDEVIESMVDISSSLKMFILHEKHGKNLPYSLRNNDADIYVINSKTAKKDIIFSMSDIVTTFEFLTYKDGVVTICGSTAFPVINGENFHIFAEVDGRVMRCTDRVRSTVCSCGLPVEEKKEFRIEIPLSPEKDICRIEFCTFFDGNHISLTKMLAGTFFPLNGKLKNSFFYADDRIFTLNRCGIQAKLSGKKALVAHETALQKEIKKKKFFKAKKICFLRTVARLYRLFFKKPIWLISDRINGGDDNGEAFFNYVKKRKDIRAYFVIGKEHKKVGRKIGRTITIGSFRHSLYSLVAQHVVSSQADGKMLRVTFCNNVTINDLYSQNRFVFLQHGVAMTDLSDYVSKHSKDISLFITSSKYERDSITDNAGYGLLPSEVALTGIPRFDRLYNDTKKIITVMPTWRQSLADNFDSASGEWTYSEGKVKESDFYKFYYSLLTDKRLLDAAENYGYKITMFPHPNIKNILRYFPSGVSDIFVGKKYRDVYAQSSLVLTDYSSAVFDFAYLHKPIVYAQFDSDKFYSGQVYTKGFFNFDTMGFGEVTNDLEDTVDVLIEYMQNGCDIKEKYRERIDNFFEYIDKNNCRRVFESIKNM